MVDIALVDWYCVVLHKLYTCCIHVDWWVDGWCTGRYQLRSRAHLNPAIRRRTLGDTLSFGLHSSTLGNFLKFVLASLSTFTLFDNLYCLCVGVEHLTINKIYFYKIHIFTIYLQWCVSKCPMIIKIEGILQQMIVLVVGM